MIENQLPPVEQECLDTAIACEGCELAANGICGYLERGQRFQELQKEHEDLQGQYEETRRMYQDERARGERSSMDDTIEGFMTIAGVERMIEEDLTLAQEITEGTVGMVVIDLRGLKAVNEKHGHTFGDILLNEGGQRLASLRRDEKYEFREEDRRETNDYLPDVCFRGLKSDELHVLLRNVRDPRDLERIYNDRILPVFTVGQGIADSRAGRMPILANGSMIHSSEIGVPTGNYPEQRQKELAQLMLGKMIKISQTGLHDTHGAQVDEMWAHAVAASGGLLTTRPADERLIIQSFWEYCCPDFDEDTILRSRQKTTVQEIDILADSLRAELARQSARIKEEKPLFYDDPEILSGSDFTEVLASRFSSYETSVDLVGLLDIDQFVSKKHKEQYGKEAIDHAYVQIAEALKGSIREGDLLGFDDDGRFMFCMPDAEIDDAQDQLVKLLETIRTTATPSYDGPLTASISCLEVMPSGSRNDGRSIIERTADLLSDHRQQSIMDEEIPELTGNVIVYGALDEYAKRPHDPVYKRPSIEDTSFIGPVFITADGRRIDSHLGYF